MMKIAVAITLLSAATTSAKLVRGKAMKGNAAWSFRMNEPPADCVSTYTVEDWKLKYPKVSYCTPQNMWHRYQGSEYFVLEEYQTAVVNDLPGQSMKMTYENAKTFCEDIESFLGPVYSDNFTIGINATESNQVKYGSAHLLSIASEGERDFVVSLQANNRHGVWLGIKRSEDKYNTGTKDQKGFLEYDQPGSISFNYQSWANGEPNSQRYGTDNGFLVDTWKEKCIFMGINKGDPSLFNDAVCEKKRRVVCKRPILQPIESGLCNGQADPMECDNYYDAKCNDRMDPLEESSPTWDSVCLVKCRTCDQTSTTFASTTTTDVTTTSTAVTTTTTAVTTTTTDVTTTTTDATTTTTDATTTTTAFTTTTTAVTSTTTQIYTTTTTTAEPSTTTTSEPTTIYEGACSQARGWSETVEMAAEQGYKCCYKYVSKPRLPWAEAEQACAALGDEYSDLPQSAGHLAGAFLPSINEVLRLQRNEKSGKANAETAWLGGNIFHSSPINATILAEGNVEWINPWHAEAGFNMAYGTNFFFLDEQTNYRQRNTTCPLDDSDPLCQTNGMFYHGEPSGMNMNKGKRGVAEECIMMGSNKKVGNQVGDNFWNDGKCAVKKSYFCEFCFKAQTTTTPVPTSTTTVVTSTSTAAKTTTTTDVTTTTTDVTTTTTAVTSTSTAAKTTTTTDVTTTSTAVTTTSTAAPDCTAILCSTDCGNLFVKGDTEWESFCGWSKKHQICLEGARTTKKELNQGVCTVGAGTEGPKVVTTITTTTPLSRTCGDLYCSMTCAGDCVRPKTGYTLEDIELEGFTFSEGCAEYSCGWSRKHNRCLAGPKAKTNYFEQTTPLGPKCPLP